MVVSFGVFGIATGYYAVPRIAESRNLAGSRGVSQAAYRVEAGPRHVYRYSVVPGGIRSAAEAMAASRRDPLVAAHYADVATKHLEPLPVGKAKLRFVSYRRGNRILWTRARHRVAAGELTLTDGKNEIRARCGNRLSETEQLPIAQSSGDEPSDSELGTVGVEDLRVVKRLPQSNAVITSPEVGLLPEPLTADLRPAGHPVLLGNLQSASDSSRGAAPMLAHMPSGSGLQPPVPSPAMNDSLAESLVQLPSKPQLVPPTLSQAFDTPQVSGGLIFDRSRPRSVPMADDLNDTNGRIVPMPGNNENSSPLPTGNGGGGGVPPTGGQGDAGGTTPGNGIIISQLTRLDSEDADGDRRGRLPDVPRNPEPIPEPGTWALMLTAGSALLLIRRFMLRGNCGANGSSRTPSYPKMRP